MYCRVPPLQGLLFSVALGHVEGLNKWSYIMGGPRHYIVVPRAGGVTMFFTTKLSQQQCLFLFWDQNCYQCALANSDQ